MSDAVFKQMWESGISCSSILIYAPTQKLCKSCIDERRTQTIHLLHETCVTHATDKTQVKCFCRQLFNFTLRQCEFLWKSNTINEDPTWNEMSIMSGVRYEPREK